MSDLARKTQQEIEAKGWRVVLREWCEAPSCSPYQMFEIINAVPSLLDILERTERKVEALGGTLDAPELRLFP